uniref:Uncharacterized protein n=1 Tax=Mycena chlorophos TaxID=658473 RepID=A0ABQ0KY77_MYCCL|nr:predicted protein [Mycena chlorophos]
MDTSLALFWADPAESSSVRSLLLLLGETAELFGILLEATSDELETSQSGSDLEFKLHRAALDDQIRFFHSCQEKMQALRARAADCDRRSRSEVCTDPKLHYLPLATGQNLQDISLDQEINAALANCPSSPSPSRMNPKKGKTDGTSAKASRIPRPRLSIRSGRSAKEDLD